MTIAELKQKRIDLLAQVRAIQEGADNEKRPVTAEEEKQMNDFLGAIEATTRDIDRREQMEAVQVQIESPGKRKVAPEDSTTMTAAGKPGASTVTGGTPVVLQTGTYGFNRLGDFAVAVHASALGAGTDPRLHQIRRMENAAASTIGSEGTGADGGYLVPPDFRTQILEKVMAEEELLARTWQQTTTSNSITFPVDETTPWQTSGGVLAFWEGEAQAYQQSKPGLKSTTVRATKLTALVPVTDELLEDAPSLEGFLRKKTPEKMTYKINDAILNGDGNGKPFGILNSAALITVAKETSQVAATVNFKNIQKMWSSMYRPLRRNAVWVANQDVEPQLAALAVPSDDSTKSAGVFPAYLQPNGLVGGPDGTLMGRPIIYTEAASALGTAGDISLVDFQQYLSVLKAGGLKNDISIHLWFDQGLTAFRFTWRIGGQTWWSAPITRAKSSNPLSAFVTLATRS